VLVVFGVLVSMFGGLRATGLRLDEFRWRGAFLGDTHCAHL
jgi:hypothetical protein